MFHLHLWFYLHPAKMIQINADVVNGIGIDKCGIIHKLPQSLHHHPVPLVLSRQNHPADLALADLALTKLYSVSFVRGRGPTSVQSPPFSSCTHPHAVHSHTCLTLHTHVTSLQAKSSSCTAPNLMIPAQQGFAVHNQHQQFHTWAQHNTQRDIACSPCKTASECPVSHSDQQQCQSNRISRPVFCARKDVPQARINGYVLLC